MGEQQGQQASVEDRICICGGKLGAFGVCLRCGDFFPEPPRPLIPGGLAHCGCGATAGVKEKPHAEGCPNHPEEQKRRLSEFMAPSDRCPGCGARAHGLDTGHAPFCPELDKPEKERWPRPLYNRVREGLIRERVEREAAKVRDYGFLRARASRPLSEHDWSEHAAADAFWAHWREHGETHKHGYYESTWGAIRAALKVAPEFLTANEPVAPEEPKPHRAHAPSWLTCPCGQLSRPGGDTRTNVYRAGELVEVRYPHGGVQCCWTREKRR